jgi:hypothetical protein
MVISRGYFLPKAGPACVHRWLKRAALPKTKKADVVEYPKALDHVGLLFNKPPGRTGLLFI